MKLVRYYPEISNNHGIIKSVGPLPSLEGYGLHIEVDTFGTVHKNCCLGFEPKVGDEVELWVEDNVNSSAGWIITLGHTQETKREVE
jgi:hypothetical protein